MLHAPRCAFCGEAQQGIQRLWTDIPVSNLDLADVGTSCRLVGGGQFRVEKPNQDCNPAAGSQAQWAARDAPGRVLRLDQVFANAGTHLNLIQKPVPLGTSY